MIKKMTIAIIRILALLILAMVLIWVFIAQPTFKSNTRSSARVDQRRLKHHVVTLARTYYPRNHREMENLDLCAAYIKKHFEKAGGRARYQDYAVSDKRYRNVIGVFGKDKGNKIIIGAHYDSFYSTPGADDNASGVAGLIELAYLFGREKPGKEIELVAYTLEEPPYFMTSHMGSVVHSDAIYRNKEKIKGVIVLEMIGYFSDAWGAQLYPVPIVMNAMYSNRGNFITVVGNVRQRSFTKAVKIAMKNATDLPVYSINAPKLLPGIDLSDHQSYWRHGMNAVMITDTAFYRNFQYHQSGDTPDRLDYQRMSRVVIAVFEAAKSM